MSVFIRNRFYARRANTGKITYLGEILLFDAFLRKEPLTQGQEILSQETIDS